MVDFNTTDRGRLAEDEYFRRRDAVILERARETERVALERTALARALGTPLVASDPLHAHGLRASTAALVDWLPAVEVAWLDGADDSERHALRVQLNAEGAASAEALTLLDEWLTERPPDALFSAGRQALKARLQTVDADERGAMLARIVAICEATGRAAGGCFGIGALSADERRQIGRIRADLEQPL